MDETMKKTSLQIAPPDIDALIVSVRGQKVILDADLARIYRVPTKALNQAVKRNREKFPEDFLFQLTPGEAEEIRNSTPPLVSSLTPSIRSQIVTASLRSQIVTSNSGRADAVISPTLSRNTVPSWPPMSSTAPRQPKRASSSSVPLSRCAPPSVIAGSLPENWRCSNKNSKPAWILTKPPSWMSSNGS